jgi:hypothetical protein
MLRIPRRMRKSVLVLLALLMVSAVAQLGPGASSAFALDKNNCSPHWATREQVTGTGLNIIERCEPVVEEEDPATGDPVTVWDWTLYRFKSAVNNQRTIWSSGCAYPGYLMVLNDLMSNGSGGGAAGGRVILYDCNGNRLNRTIAARVVIQYYRPDGWYTCNDSGWRQASQQQSWMSAYLNQWSQPDCGAGSYRALAAGRFWSISLNKWITRGWIYSPSISLSSGTGPAEPTITPTPTPQTPD